MGSAHALGGACGGPSGPPTQRWHAIIQGQGANHAGARRAAILGGNPRLLGNDRIDSRDRAPTPLAQSARTQTGRTPRAKPTRAAPSTPDCPRMARSTTDDVGPTIGDRRPTTDDRRRPETTDDDGRAGGRAGPVGGRTDGSGRANRGAWKVRRAVGWAAGQGTSEDGRGRPKTGEDDDDDRKATAGGEEGQRGRTSEDERQRRARPTATNKGASQGVDGAAQEADNAARGGRRNRPTRPSGGAPSHAPRTSRFFSSNSPSGSADRPATSSTS